MYTKIRSHITNLISSHFKNIPDHHILNIPYFSQWESPSLVDKILSHKIEAQDDPKWKNSGAKSKEEYQYWSWNLCGTACLKMILAYENSNTNQLVPLAQEIASYGGYLPRQDNTIDGLFYKPFIQYLRDKRQHKAIICNPLSLSRIKYELSQNNFLVVSVNQNIRDPKSSTPIIKTGHLVLITGYDESQQIFYLHNPSGYYHKSQKNHKISYQDFVRFFSGRGIIIYGKKEN